MGERGERERERERESESRRLRKDLSEKGKEIERNCERTGEGLEALGTIDGGGGKKNERQKMQSTKR